MKSAFFILIIFITCAYESLSQSNEHYLVNIPKLNMRVGPSKDAELLKSLQINDLVTLIGKKENGWWLVDFGGIEGYVIGKALLKDKYEGWDTKKYLTGETPDCENIIPEYDTNLDNYLKVNVGSHTDVVVKLMRKSQNDEDICIRIVFIRSNQSFNIKNIPEGNYYLKIAYGKNWRQKIVDNQCFGKFMNNAHYEIGKQKLNYNLIHKDNSISVPSFELLLDVIQTKTKKSNFNTSNISEEIFNK